MKLVNDFIHIFLEIMTISVCLIDIVVILQIKPLKKLKYTEKK